MTIEDSNKLDSLKTFLQASPTPFHAVSSMVELLEAAGFEQLPESDTWMLEPQRAYYVTRNDSSLIAFRTGKGNLLHQGFNMVGAHTDSPCLKVKPQADVSIHGYGQLGVEVYGGALLNPWFDRDLSIAGRVSYVTEEGNIQSCLVDFEAPVAIIPSLAIHLDREANKGRTINEQTMLPPILLQLEDDEKMDFRELIADQILHGLPEEDINHILSYELCLYDVQPPAEVGVRQEFLASARLDNLLSCYAGLEALINCGNESFSLLVCNDHEEVGSVSSSGASGPFLESVVRRITEKMAGHGEEVFRQVIEKSLLISVDNAHGIHPNFADKHDQQHGPLLNEGPVIKTNSNQRYASNSESSAVFRLLCEQLDIPVQDFVVRSDMGCGSTIGPLTAAELGICTLDIGVPTFAMHSIRELAGCKDVIYLISALTLFLSQH